MAGTTVRIAPKENQRQLIKASIDVLRGYLSKGFESTEDLQKVIPFISNPELRDRYVANISVKFEKVRVPIIMKIIATQISLLEDQLAALE